MLSTLTPILWIPIKIEKKIGQRRICIPKKNQFYYNKRLHIYFLKDSFVGYVYADVQFLKYGGYAQNICISNF
jgi:hypothetical protein